MGIQSAHLLGEMSNSAYKNFKVLSDTGFDKDDKRTLEAVVTMTEKDLLFSTWCENHKTMIVCNGGNAQSLFDLRDFFNDPRNPFPWAYFNEDEQSLNGALTCVGIVLPEEIYEVKKNLAPIDTGGIIDLGYVFDDGTIRITYEPDSYLYELISRVKSARLA
jgi:hypothetical protein